MELQIYFCSKPLRIILDKIDGFIRIFDGTRWLTLFGSKKGNAIYNRIRYPVSLKCNISYNFTQYFPVIKVDYGSLPIEKPLALHNVIILIKSVINKYKKLRLL